MNIIQDNAMVCNAMVKKTNILQRSGGHHNNKSYHLDAIV